MNHPRKFIAKGSYGIIYKNPSNPDKEVIKILSPDTNIDTEIDKAERIVRLTGDNGQRIQKIEITKNDVPSNALIEYQHLNDSHSFMKTKQQVESSTYLPWVK